MVEQAESIGVTLNWRRRVDLSTLRCGWIVGADGENSLVRKWAGLDVRLRDRGRFGFRRHFQVEPWTDHMELYWADGYQIYVTPVTPDSVCVAAISRDPRFRLNDALRGLPDLAGRLKTSRILTAERGGISASRRLRAVQRERVALIGDASGSVDAITGEGLCMVFQQALALAEAIERGDLAVYQGKHRRIARRPEWMAKLLLMLGDHAALRRGAMLALGAYPGIFRKMLAVHVGAEREQAMPEPMGASKRSSAW